MSSTTGAISGAIKWTGLASGTDFGAVVDQLVAIEQRTITRQETWKAEWQSKITAISDLNTRLVSLKLDAQSKDIRSELLSRASSISDESVIGVVNTSTAPLGSYEVTVGSAVPEKLASRTVKASDTFGAAAGGETLEIHLGDDTANKLVITVVPTGNTPGVGEVEAGFTIDELADAINAAVAATSPPIINIKAELMDVDVSDSDPLNHTKRLVITALDGGSANHIHVNETNAITGLELHKTHIGTPIKTTFLGSNADIDIDSSSYYTGSVNKTITFVAANTGVLGVDDVTIQWADEYGNSGKLEIKAADYAANPSQSYDIIQGLKITLDTLDASNPPRFIEAESFTIDLQAPTLQKGQDTGVAQTAKVVHSGVVDQISPIHTGSATSFTYTYRGKEYSVAVTSSTSLGTLVSAINGATNNPGVTATVVNDGQGTTTSYHLVLTGYHTGAESEITIKDTGITGLNTGAGGFTVSREATNSMIKVDGFPARSDTYIQRTSNDGSDVIEGVVLTVKGAGTSTLTVNNDPAAIRDKILQLVQSVNFCKTYILENTKWGGSNLEVDLGESGEVVTSRDTANGLMIGNYGFQIAQSKLDAFMHTALVPFSENPALSTKERIEKREAYMEEKGLTYITLSEIGITSDPDNQGLYKVEESKLLECIQKDPEGVLNLFTFSDEYTDIGKDGKPKTVVIQGAALALGVELTKLTSTTDVTDEEGNVIQQGKGIMVTLQENYEGIVKNINEKIAREERRIEAVRQRLTDRFNRLEVALQTLQDQQTQLESSIASLSSNSDD